MKIQLTIDSRQLELLAQSLNFVILKDNLLDKLDPAWKELHAIVRLANEEVNNGMIRQASYTIIP